MPNSDLLDRFHALPPDRKGEFMRALRRDHERYDLHLLTAAQRRMWLHDQLWPGSRLCLVDFRIELAGPLDVPALVAAFDRVLARHQGLRTVFLDIDGEQWQWVLPESPAMTRLRVADAVDDQPLALDETPPVRATLVPTGPDRWVLHLRLHHIVCDGWSMGLVFDDLSRCYAGETAEPAPRHVDVAVESDEERLVSFWRATLEGTPPTTELPVDRPRPPVLDEAGGQHTFTWPAELGERVAAFAARLGATPFMVLLAAWKAVLFRYGNEDGVVVAAPVACRTTLAAEGAVGLFTNSVALRSTVDSGTAFVDLVGRVRDTTLAALAHQELPFDTVVDRLRVARDPGSTPLARVMFAVESAWAERLRLPGVEVRAAEVHNGTATYDLTLTLVPGATGIAGRLEYRTSLFDHATAVRVAEHVRTLLTAALADPDRRIAELPMLGSAERRAIDFWSSTRLPVADERPVDELVAEVAPDRVAVVGPGRTVTYGELMGRANQLAALLCDRGVVAETPVGVCLPPGADQVAAFLGVLMAGGMYVPLAADLPAERVRVLVEDSGVAVVLAHTATAGTLPPGTPVVSLDTTEFEPRPRPRVTIGPDQAAYLIYTSGSTGRPKGVVNTHRGLSNLAAAIRDLLPVRPEDRVLQFHSAGFDAVVSDMLTALCAGAQLHLVDRHERIPGSDLAHTLRTHRISVLDVPPVALGAMNPADVPELRLLTVGGEACPPDIATAWARDRLFYNTYGPTETSVMVTAGVIDGPMVHIGRPMTGARIYVLDSGLRPVPVGVVGELYIGGACLGRGYLGRAALTAAAFVPDPFAGSGSRMYRTGDFARWRADGTLDIVGRRDAQVKIRGNRVELGEVEAALRALAGVRRCAVVVREDQPGNRQLVGYVVPTQALNVDTLRGELQRTLPDYLVPGAFVELAELPLTPNGKLDQRALPAPAASRPRLGTAFRSPRGVTEVAVAEVWCTVLGLDRVGADDNFFDLGGNSMLVVKVHSGLVAALDVELAAVDLFRYPTVAGLARYLDGEEPAPAPARRVADRRALTTRTRRVRGEQGRL
jgi:amino acid adenylation domain-containing protein